MEMNMGSAKTAYMGPMGLNAARCATAKGAYVIERQALASLSDSLLNLPASSSPNHNQVERPGQVK